jgi:hypothetical protein
VRLTILSSVGGKNFHKRAASFVNAKTHLAGGEHALDRDTDGHNAQGWGPVITEDGNAYLGESMSEGDIRDIQRGAYMTIRIDMLGWNLAPDNAGRAGSSERQRVYILGVRVA